MREHNVNVPITKANLRRFNVYCKLEGMTQSEAFEKLIEEHTPEYKMHLKVS